MGRKKAASLPVLSAVTAVNGLTVGVLGALFLSACSSVPAPQGAPDLVGLYAGQCDAGEGWLDLRADGSFLLLLVEAKGGTQWTLTGRWFDGGSTRASKLGGDPEELDGVVRLFALQCEHWRLRWSIGPRLTPGDRWSPPVTYDRVHAVSERGVLFLNAFARFVLPRMDGGAPYPAGA